MSNKEQGQSGLGLDEQQAVVAEYVRQQGGNLIVEYVEVETGKS